MASNFKKKTAFALKTGLLEHKSTHVDTRPIIVRMADYFPIVMPYLFIGAGVLALIPEISYFIFVFFTLFMLYAVSVQFDYLINAPIFASKNALLEAKRKAKSPIKKGDAVLLLGYDLLFGRQLWIEIDRETRMMLISGTTGSGKTVTANSMLAQFALQGHFKGGAPILICDGKGSIEGLYQFLFYCVRTGRLHDVRLLNFLTGGEKIDPDGVLDDMFPSNRFNPFSILNAEEIRGLILSFGRSSEGGNSEFFKDRASTMLAGVGPVWVYNRDALGETLNATIIQQSLNIQKLLDFACDEAKPSKIRKGLKEYLKTLQGINDATFISRENIKLDKNAEEQHSYNTSMLSKTINEMADSLGHIFNHSGSEVNLRTGFQTGHITIVLLPTIEKEPDAMSELGRMVIGSLRPAITPIFGFATQGTYEQIVKSLPNGEIPIRLMFDEILNYYVKGMSNFLSLLRSSHIAMYLLGQSLKGIEDAGVSEGRQSLANLNNILAFGTQDVYETMEKLEKTLGKVRVTRLSEMNTKEWGGYKNSDRLQISEEHLVSARDMAGADPMEGLYIYRGEPIPFMSSTLFIPKGQDLSSFKLNLLAGLHSPSVDDVKYALSCAGLKDRSSDEHTTIAEPSSNAVISNFIDDLNRNHVAAKKLDIYSADLDLLTFALVGELLENDDNNFNEMVDEILQEADLSDNKNNKVVSTKHGVTEVIEKAELIIPEKKKPKKENAEGKATPKKAKAKPVNKNDDTEAALDKTIDEKLVKDASASISERYENEKSSGAKEGTVVDFERTSSQLGVFDCTGIIALIDDDIDEPLSNETNTASIDPIEEQYGDHYFDESNNYLDDEGYYEHMADEANQDAHINDSVAEGNESNSQTSSGQLTIAPLNDLFLSGDERSSALNNMIDSMENEFDGLDDFFGDVNGEGQEVNSALQQQEQLIDSQISDAERILQADFSSIYGDLRPRPYPDQPTPPVQNIDFQEATVDELRGSVDDIMRGMFND